MTWGKKGKSRIIIISTPHRILYSFYYSIISLLHFHMLVSFHFLDNKPVHYKIKKWRKSIWKLFYISFAWLSIVVFFLGLFFTATKAIPIQLVMNNLICFCLPSLCWVGKGKWGIAQWTVVVMEKGNGLLWTASYSIHLILCLCIPPGLFYISTIMHVNRKEIIPIEWNVILWRSFFFKFSVSFVPKCMCCPPCLLALWAPFQLWHLTSWISSVNPILSRLSLLQAMVEVVVAEMAMEAVAAAMEVVVHLNHRWKGNGAKLATCPRAKLKFHWKQFDGPEEGFSARARDLPRLTELWPLLVLLL